MRESADMAVATPGFGAPAVTPPGVIYNTTPDFPAGPGLPSHFLYATEDGIIVAWNSGGHAVLKADNSVSGAVYKGLAQGRSGGRNFLYAANSHAGRVDVFDEDFKLIDLPGAFTDPAIPEGFAPFNIQNIDGKLYVAYARQDAGGCEDMAGPGNGFINIFDTRGNLLRRFASGGALNSPWGMTVAPAWYGAFGGALLVGNFGDGRINAFSLATGDLLGTLRNSIGSPISIEGLRALAFGSGERTDDRHALYFLAGAPAYGDAGGCAVFGRITAVVPSIVSVAAQGHSLTVKWVGGAGPFVLQKKTSLSAAWRSLITTYSRAVTIAHDGEPGFYRIMNPAQINLRPSAQKHDFWERYKVETSPARRTILPILLDRARSARC